MPDTKYGNLIVTELKAPEAIMTAIKDYSKIGKRILWMDSNVVPGAFQMNCSWHLYTNNESPKSHSHDTDEIIGFFGNNPEVPYDLGAEIELWMGGQKLIIDRSVMVFIPAGVEHCPLYLRRVDRPIFHFSVITGSVYSMKDGGWVTTPASGYGDNVVTELKIPPEKVAIQAEYNKYARRILWMDKHVVPEAFHLNTAWYLKASETLENVPHVHETDDEIIGFFGNDPDNPSDLGGEIEIWMGDEKHIITKSAMIFVPAGLPHCPLILRRVDRPIFHFTTVPGKQYIKDDRG